MKYSLLGHTGIFVSRICLGAMTFGGADNPIGNALGRLSQDDSNSIVDRAIDSGINFFDTADVYGGGESEVRLGNALEKHRKQVVLATKFSARVGVGPNDVGQSRLHIMDAVNESLRRLGTDYIDLYQLHNFDPMTPTEETLRALEDLVRLGKVRYIGCSNLMAWQLMKSLGASDRLNLPRYVSVQSFYSLACRDVERELVPAALDQNVSILCWSPLAGGLLSNKFDREGPSDPSARRTQLNFPPVDKEKVYLILDVLKKVAVRHDATVTQIALAWLLAQSSVASVISGVRTPVQLEENLKSIDIVLTAQDLHELDEVSGDAPTYPGWIQSYNARGRVPKDHPFVGRSWSAGEEPK